MRVKHRNRDGISTAEDWSPWRLSSQMSTTLTLSVKLSVGRTAGVAQSVPAFLSRHSLVSPSTSLSGGAEKAKIRATSHRRCLWVFTQSKAVQFNLRVNETANITCLYLEDKWGASLWISSRHANNLVGSGRTQPVFQVLQLMVQSCGWDQRVSKPLLGH